MCIRDRYGLILISISKRTKEIGLRRVLGAALHQILFAVGKELLILVLIAVVLGGPLSYYLLSTWQANFAYTIPMDLSVIFIAGVTLFILALTVIMIQTNRVSRINPSESLRYE